MSEPLGLLLVDKPGGVTSHGVVARARRALGTRKVGHAGTLDPMATGLLVLGVGRATRLLTYLVGADKEYLATIRLGQSTITDDAEGEVTQAVGARVVGTEELDAALGELTGDIRQVPSAVSAIKVDGKRSYARVRAGESVELPARPVTVHSLQRGEPRPATAPGGTAVTDVEVVVECSSGTYIRAIARDLGAALGVGGHLTSLRRTRVGAFRVDDSVPLDSLTTAAPGSAGEFLLPLGPACRAIFPGIDLDGALARELRYGRPIPPVPDEGIWAAFDEEGGVIGLVQNREGRARPVLVLDPA
ncbi:MAG: tRNA pseudouridine(55) synthase TruB [bacterium]|nr:tRNA pseudouridine(55) synthase TruB [bacterium]